MQSIHQHCPICQRVTRLPAGAATWGCCGVTYTAHCAADGTVSICWAQGERSDLLFAATFPTPPAEQQTVALLKRGRPAKKG